MIKGFLTNLADYNNGMLNGKWITFPLAEDEIEKIFIELNIDEEHEYFFTDWETELEYNFGEYENIFSINEIAEELESVDIDHLNAYLEAYGTDYRKGLSYAIDRYEDYAFRPNADLLDIAYEIVEECYDLPEFATRYFDYEAFARDLSYDGYVETSYGVIYE